MEASHNVLGLSLLVTVFLLTLGISPASAQIRPPGYERELKAMEERMRTSVLDQDSLTLVDTITLFDPETSEESVKVVRSTISWRDYCNLRLGINDPDKLLNGEPMIITDPQTYEEMTVRWNAAETKLDTLLR